MDYFYIWQTDRYNLMFRHEREINGELYKVVHEDLNLKKDKEEYIKRLMSEVVNNSSMIDNVSTSVKNDTVYESINIGKVQIVLQNPKDLYRRQEFRNVEKTLDKHNNLVKKVKEDKLKLVKTAKKIVAAIGVAATFTASFLATKFLLPNKDKTNEKDDFAKSENAPSIVENVQVEEQPNEIDTSNETIPVQQNTLEVEIEAKDIEPIETYSVEEPIIQEEPVLDDVEIENYSIDEQINNDEIACFIKRAYGMTNEQLREVMNNNASTLENADNYYLALKDAAKSAYDNNRGAYNPQELELNTLTIEQDIVTAAKIYGITDDETLATFMGVARLETGCYTSGLCQYANNFGGIALDYKNGQYTFAAYESREMGAIQLVRTVLANRDYFINNGTYDYNKTLAHNIGDRYCPENMPGVTTPWYVCVDQYKNNILNNGELNNYQREFATTLSSEGRRL